MPKNYSNHYSEIQVIERVRNLLDKINNGSIDITPLTPLVVFSIKIFAKLQNVSIYFAPTPRFRQLDSIISKFLDSELTFEELSNYLDTLKNNLNIIKQDNLEIEYIIYQVQFLILLNYLNEKFLYGHEENELQNFMYNDINFDFEIPVNEKPYLDNPGNEDSSKSFNFIDRDLIDNLLKKIGKDDFDDFVEFLKLWDNNYQQNLLYRFLFHTHSIGTFNDIPLESLVELKLNDIIRGLNTSLKYKSLPANLNKKGIFYNIRIRRLLFIGQVYNKLDLFQNDNLFSPSPSLIYNIFFAASALILLRNNKNINADDIWSAFRRDIHNKEFNGK